MNGQTNESVAAEWKNLFSFLTQMIYFDIVCLCAKKTCEWG